LATIGGLLSRKGCGIKELLSQTVLANNKLAREE